MSNLWNFEILERKLRNTSIWVRSTDYLFLDVALDLLVTTWTKRDLNKDCIGILGMTFLTSCPNNTTTKDTLDFSFPFNRYDTPLFKKMQEF